MTTLAQLRGQVRLALADETTWPDAAFACRTSWPASRLYSARTSTLAARDGAGRRAARPMTCPAAMGCRPWCASSIRPRRPARCLTWADEDAAIFRMGGPVYAVRGVAEDPAQAADFSRQIVFAELVCDGEMAIVDYLTGHAACGGHSPSRMHTWALRLMCSTAQWRAVVAAGPMSARMAAWRSACSGRGGPGLAALQGGARSAGLARPTFQPPVARGGRL